MKFVPRVSRPAVTKKPSALYISFSVVVFSLDLPEARLSPGVSIHVFSVKIGSAIVGSSFPGCVPETFLP